jgi:hypothetical protein
MNQMALLGEVEQLNHGLTQAAIDIPYNIDSISGMDGLD